jgi:hypothetical protein
MQARFVISDEIFVFIFENKRFPIKYKDVRDIIRYSIFNLSFLDTKNSNRIKVSSVDNNLQIEIENYQFSISSAQIEAAYKHNSEITIYDKNSVNSPMPHELKATEISKEKGKNNLIQKNLHRLRARHYVLKGNKIGYWAHINANVLNKYISYYGENFNIILYNDSEIPLDFVSIPYSILKTKLKSELLYRGYDSWKISIYNREIKIHGDKGINRLSASPFFGNTNGLGDLV